MKQKHVVTLLGRGVEGCGVTKFTVEMNKWLKKRGFKTTIVALKDKTWSRKDSHVIDDLAQFKFAKDDQFAAAREIVDNADVVIVNSLPSLVTKKGIKAHDAKAVDNFLELIKTTKAPMIMFQHDHNKLSLRRNAGTKELVEHAKLLFAHAKTGDFAAQVAAFSGGDGLGAIFSKTAKDIKTFQPAFNFDEHREKYWLPIMEQYQFHCRWIGRTTFWKGFVPMFDLHNNYLKKAGFLTVLEGIEKSPAFLDFRTKSVFVDMLGKNPNDIGTYQYCGKDAVVFSVYNNEEMLYRMAQTAFGFQLSLLNPRFIDKSIEYTHCEIPAVGALPVFRKEFGDACIHRVTGDPLTQSKDSGTLWLPTDPTQHGVVAEQIDTLSVAHNARDEMRHKAFEFYKAHQDSDVVFADIWKEIENAIR